MEDIIIIKDLNKSFGEIKAVQNLSFRVKKGELFAFLGVNGAGKSTTINIMCGRLAKDGGTVVINGIDIDSNPRAVKSGLGVVFQDSALDKSLSVFDNLQCRAALYGVVGDEFSARLSRLSGMLELDGLLRRTVSKLSGGQRRRIDVARALLHNPGVLILDEPTTGLDPKTRKKLWSVVAELRRKENMTVFLTTHYMEEAADADNVVIIDGGRIAAQGTPLELKNRYTGDYITIYDADEADVMNLGRKYERVRDGFRLSVPDTSSATELIVANPGLFADYEITKGKMDDVFLSVTGKNLTDEGEL